MANIMVQVTAMPNTVFVSYTYLLVRLWLPVDEVWPEQLGFVD